MTLDELKKEAKKQGYYVMKPSTNYTKFLPCTCGYKKRTELHAENSYMIAYQCKRCGLQSEFRPSAEEARIAWNELIERSADDGR